MDRLQIHKIYKCFLSIINYKMNIKLMDDSFTENEFNAVLNCLKSGNYTQGQLVDSFEQKFAQWNGSKYAIMVNSGSSANLLMAFMLKEYLGLKDGDEVMVPCVTWPTTIYPLIQNNLVPILCDVDESFNLDINSLRRMIGPKTKAVFLVHLLGQPARLAEIQQICREQKLILIEDGCESMGAKYAGKKIGNFGVMGSFSFYFGHHMTTIEGGMIVTEDFKLADLLKSARSHGWVRNSARQEFYPDFENKNYLFDMLGYNLRSTDLNASIGLVQLEKLDESIKIRLDNHHYFLGRIKEFGLVREFGLNIQAVDLEKDTFTSSFSFALLFKTKAERDYILQNLGQKGIESRPIVAGNLLKQPVFRYTHLKADATPQGDQIHDCGVYLPNNQFMTRDKIDFMIDSIKKLMKEFNNLKNLQTNFC